MIFVVLGTHELPFTRLLDEMQRLIDDGIVTEDVVVQSGHTNYSTSSMNLTPFLQFDEMERTFDEARVIVSHGGTGSIITGVKKEKPVIAVPRLSAHGEHNDDHQTEIVEQFQSTGHIIAIDHPTGLEQALEEARTFEPAPFVSGRDHILGILREFINRV
ncbi:PssE/Cps14G family polysaccharide biosynthesis glycosyltransferase [Salibacterium qingdaonense]|uniref:UDP-N-acetylglucosamine transferase subunit ALG13 n=1 Tax=Salibacterium qingdaonense TaxID=266892 RepID=A0A1I4L2M0_9BACI|nr:PssE/Cps14G family polysaccharide biosynthesis glycosyltransferase [Salibacterium qingdaonense]SFL84917.1 UDP-N-acetylglucosamine transferase subunit ALG13 [Salibacterium qingdaonense]